MKNFSAVFNIIRECCTKDIPNNECYFKIKCYLKESKSTYTVEFYLEALQKLQLINFYKASNCIILTNKGSETDELFMAPEQR